MNTERMNVVTPKITEEEIVLIKRAQSGDEAAFSLLFKKYNHFVASLLYGYTKDWDEARDMTNFVFLKVYDKLSQFSTYTSFGGWLRILTNRVGIDYTRKMKNKRRTLDDSEDRLSLDDSNEQNEDDIVNHLLMQQIFDFLETLKPEIKQIFEMFYLDNMTVETISQKLRIPTGTIKSHLARTRKKIQTKLNLTK